MVFERGPFGFVRSNQGAHEEPKITSEKSFMKQEIVPQGAYLLLFLCSVVVLFSFRFY